MVVWCTYLLCSYGTVLTSWGIRYFW
eukprot:COSAG01_NODE_60629_length_293_cov_2.134021_1_plen_25_part_10